MSAPSYDPYNIPLNSLTLALAAPIHSPKTSTPALPPYPPSPSCLISLILGSDLLDFDVDDFGFSESKAMVMRVGQRGSSKADGSGRRYLLYSHEYGHQSNV